MSSCVTFKVNTSCRNLGFASKVLNMLETTAENISPTAKCAAKRLQLPCRIREALMGWRLQTDEKLAKLTPNNVLNFAYMMAYQTDITCDVSL